MKAHIVTHSFSRSKSSKPWFNTTCFQAIYDKEVAHVRHLSFPSLKFHALYISGRNRANFLKTPSLMASVKFFRHAIPRKEEKDRKEVVVSYPATRNIKHCATIPTSFSIAVTTACQHCATIPNSFSTAVTTACQSEEML